MSEDSVLDFKQSKVKVTQRSKGRMKITFKLNKEQAEAFTNFQKAVKPEGIDDETFYRQVFFNGCKAISDEVTALFEQQKAMLNAQKEQALQSQETQQEISNEEKSE